MTPLAQSLAKQLLMRPKDRDPFWRDDRKTTGLRECLTDLHCFDVTDCRPLIADLTERVCYLNSKKRNAALFSSLSFLPAPKTWIEWLDPEGPRFGVLLQQCDKPEVPTNTTPVKDPAAVMLFCKQKNRYIVKRIGFISTTTDDRAMTDEPIPIDLIGQPNVNPATHFVIRAQLCLLLINSPHIIGRKQYEPHRGLEKSLLRQFGPGKFPLHAWTEIRLHVSKPPEIDDGEPHEAHLTGKRALHFVRKHIRIRLGQLEYVTAHWRGDPALGIKQTRYRVTP